MLFVYTRPQVHYKLDPFIVLPVSIKPPSVRVCVCSLNLLNNVQALNMQEDMIMTTPSGLKVIELSLDLTLLLLSAIFIYRGVDRFLAHKIAVNTRWDATRTADFPSFTICSGFRKGNSLYREFVNLPGKILNCTKNF